MKLPFGDRPRASGSEGARPGPHLLVDRGVLAAWFIEYRLVQEVERACRYECPLAVLRATPQLLPGEVLPEPALLAAAEAAVASARSTDLVGWEGAQSILILMPETSAEDARIAAARWRDEIWLHSRGAGGTKWQITLLEWQITPLEDGGTPPGEPSAGIVSMKAARREAA